jgi:response regulator of citrate/malate metabolism
VDVEEYGEGVIDYLVKPFRLGELERAVKKGYYNG